MEEIRRKRKGTSLSVRRSFQLDKQTQLLLLNVF
jgi:hypothetical protein